jgi:4-hydroxythreonine-4-phosphate dehydrogenase
VTRPLLALTIGDPAGIGPEIVLRLLAGDALPARLLVVGDRRVLERDLALVPGASLPPRVEDPECAVTDDRPALLWEPLEPMAPPPPGRVSAVAGASSHAWVEAAASLAKAGRVAGMVTGPIHKAAWHLAGRSGPGHTEVLCGLAGVDRVLLSMVAGRMRVALATLHVPLRAVPGLLRTDALEQDLHLLARETARWFGPDRPRLAVAGLNPHAGEGGLFGDEDEGIIRPAVEAARGRGVDVHGPLPADACLPQAAAGVWDAVLAMYHDQALPAVKTVAPRGAVNVTLGLPFVRTSVDHGTAFDRVGRGRASAASLVAAVEVAAAMAARRSAHSSLNAARPPSDLSEGTTGARDSAFSM